MRAAARAKVATTNAGQTSSRTSATKKNMASSNGGPKAVQSTGAVRARGSSLHPGIVGRDGDHVRQLNQWAGARGKAKTVPAVGGKQDCEDDGKEGNEAETSEGASSIMVFNPVTLFRCGVSAPSGVKCSKQAWNRYC